MKSTIIMMADLKRKYVVDVASKNVDVGELCTRSACQICGLEAERIT